MLRLHLYEPHPMDPGGGHLRTGLDCAMVGVIKGNRAIISHALQTPAPLMERQRCEPGCKLTPERLPCRPSSSRLWPCSPLHQHHNHHHPLLASQTESNLAKALRAHLFLSRYCSSFLLLLIPHSSGSLSPPSTCSFTQGSFGFFLNKLPVYSPKVNEKMRQLLFCQV